jgi:predicted transport protein
VQLERPLPLSFDELRDVGNAGGWRDVTIAVRLSEQLDYIAELIRLSHNTPGSAL